MANKLDGLALLKEWSKRLGLQDWRISLHDNCKPEEMSMEEVAGCSVWQECNKTAVIEIIDEQYYGDDRVVGFDYEKTLVHELLHLKTSLISSNVDDLQERVTHQLIDDLARAFVDAKRFKSREKKETS
jgi:hypothetical protein